MLAARLARPDRGRDRTILIAALGALVGAAWLALWLWGQSPAARLLGHEGLGDGATPAEAVVFVAGWTLMIVAMMLPTVVPLVVVFHALTRTRFAGNRLVVLLVAGYLGTWALVGVGLHTADRAIHALVAATPLLSAHPYLVTAATLLVAGVYQFSSIKYRCLDECRSPLGFVLTHWRGLRPRREALALGVRHGLFCVGCCWSLMLVMFAVGLGSLAWMLGLGALMAIEKNTVWGRRLSRPIGLALVLAAVGVVAGV